MASAERSLMRLLSELPSSIRTTLLIGGDNARLSSLPRHAGSIAALPRLRCRSAHFAVTPCRTPRGLMHRLSRRMDAAAIKWPQHQVQSAEYWENPFIPSGYTYLLQFVRARPRAFGHSALGRGRSRRRNHECAPRAPLRLETLYGSGPVGIAVYIYALDAPNDDRRTKLAARANALERERAGGAAARSATSRGPRPRT